jgi:NADH dehydrogenase
MLEMDRILHRGLIGALSGTLAGVILVGTLGLGAWALALGAVVGAAYSVGMRPTHLAYVDNMMTGGALGIPLWGLISVIVIPSLFGQMPEWTAEQIRHHFPALVGWVEFGVMLGIANQGLNDCVGYIWGPEKVRESPKIAVKQRIVILGGGFGGMRTAECLEEKLGTDFSVSLTLVNETNALLFTPMLAEVAGSSIEPSHISTPLRNSLKRTEFIRGVVKAVDLENRTVTLLSDLGADEKSAMRQIAYDHLVFALGAVPNYFGNINIEKLSFKFKSLLDAIRIRNHVIEMFECADRESDPDLRRALLTFVIAGGGFAGVELAGALNDFAHGILADYPNLQANELSIVLIHPSDRILPELSESLGRYAQRKMEIRGVKFRMNTRLTDVRPGTVVLNNGEIMAKTLVWTAGTTPNPLLSSVPLEKNKRGALVVDETLAVPGRSDLWAIGDCAAVTDASTGKPCPPTAQFAIREAEVLANNITARIKGRDSRKFHFDSLGALCVVGHQTACAELRVPFTRGKYLQFSGLFAWALWRGIYLAKLPGFERKIRVLMDWTIELFFPRDIVQTIDLR